MSAKRLTCLAALLVLPGLYLRFHGLSWMEFGGDELSILYDSYRALHERFAWHGIPASIGVPLPNFLLYVLALPVSLTRDPVWIAGFIALWNVLGLACVLRVLWRLLPPAAALAGTALLASAPGPILLARKIWNPDLVFGGVALLLLLLALDLERPRRWVTAGLFVVAAILCGFHASAWPLLPCVLAWAWVFRVKLEPRGLWLGLAALLLLFVPYAWYFVSSHFDDVRMMLHTRAANVAVTTESFGTALAGHARGVLDTSCSGGLLAAGVGPAWSRAVAHGFVWWTGAAVLIVILRTPWLAWRARKGLEVPALDKLLALGALFELLLLCAYAKAHVPALPHYYAVLIPFPTLAAVWLGWRLGARLGHVPLVAASALVVGAHTTLFADFQGELEQSGPPPGLSYTHPYAPKAAEWRAEIARLFDAVDAGRADERAEQERQRMRFEASSEVLMRYDPTRDEPPASSSAPLELRPGPEGLEVLQSSVRNMLRLPPFALGGRGRALLRLELWSPKDVFGCIFYTTDAQPEYARGHALRLDSHQGGNVYYFEIPDADASGRIMVNHVAYRWVLRAAEVRRVQD
jgi:hypothetical protein